MSPDSLAFWRAYCEATGAQGKAKGEFGFGDDPQLADELIELVLIGRKRATVDLMRNFNDENPVPQVGDHWVVLDGSKRPRCIIQSTDIDIKPLNKVDDQFAYDEGEGDRSLAYWKKAHDDYFSREAERKDLTYHDGLETVFERFKVLWPPEVAD